MFVVIGTSTIDFFISGLDRIPTSGGDEFTSDNIAFCAAPLSMILGGNGGNAAYVLARLGAPVTLCSAAGRDRWGDLICAWQEEAGTNLDGLVRGQAATSTTTVITDKGLNRLAFHHPGASEVFSLDDVPAIVWEAARLVLITSYPLLTAWRPHDVRRALTLARRRGAITALDIGPAIGQPATLAELSLLLPQVDYFLSNEHELAVCSGAADLERGMAQVLDAGAACVVAKRGGRGAAVRQADFARPLYVPGFEVEVHFTVGAGDSFNAGFLFGVAQGWDLWQAARFGNATAALVVSAAQGVLGAPRRTAVEALLNAQQPLS